MNRTGDGSTIDCRVLSGCIVESSEIRDRYGNPCLRLLLQIGNATWLAWYRGNGRLLPQLPEGLEVVVDARDREWKGERILHVLAIEPARLSARISLPGGVEAMPGWLPRVAARSRDVHRLWAHLQLFESGLLRQFACRVLHDPEIALPFVRSPASREHHHSEPGGLLLHALECMSAWAGFPGIPALEVEIGRVAGLFHDIGKIRMAYGDRKRTSEAIVTEHDDATLEVLSPHLAWLRSQAPELATALKHHLSRDEKRGRQWLPGPVLVRAIDRLSATVDMRRRSFQEAEPWQRYVRREGGGPTDRFWTLDRKSVPCNWYSGWG